MTKVRKLLRFGTHQPSLKNVIQSFWKPEQARMLQSLLLEVSKQVELLHQAARSYYWREIKNKTFRFPPWVWRICPLSLRLCLCRLLHPATGILNVSKGEILVTKQEDKGGQRWPSSSNLCRAWRTRLSVLLFLCPRSSISLSHKVRPAHLFHPTMKSDIVGGETHLEDRAGHVQVKGLFPTKHLS